jgi:exonuclease III
MTLRVLFWNVNGRRAAATDSAFALLPALVRAHQPDVLTLIEAPANASDRLRSLELTAELVQELEDNPRRLLTFTLNRGLTIVSRGATRHHRAYEVAVPGRRPLNLVAVHLRSMTNDKGDPDRQRMRAQECRRFVEDIEGDTGHARTVVYGDFNMDPFARATVNIDGLNAMSTAWRARRSRTLEGTTRRTFYNPMWSLLGDRPPVIGDRPPVERPSPAGTYYVDDEGPAGYFWHMPDQVLLRAELIPYLIDVAIIDEVDGHPLVGPKAHKPCVSDHLPVVLHLGESVWEDAPQ